MRKRLNARAKPLRAFRAYLDLQATTDWIRAEMRGQLQVFDMTLAGFRVLEMLYREGSTHINETARRLESDRRNLYVVVHELEERGLVRRVKGTLQLVDNPRNRELKAMGDTGQRGGRSDSSAADSGGEEFHCESVSAARRSGEVADAGAARARAGNVEQIVQETPAGRFYKVRD
jgi:MarR family protein